MVTNAPTESVVVCQKLVKIFKDFWMRDRARAVDGVSFTVERGEIFGLLGPNGSGKSTTIKLILGLLKPTAGRVAVFGLPPTDVSIKKRIGYLPEESYLYGFLNARETLDYYGKLFELERRVRRGRIDELLEMVGLSGAQHRQVREYSKGMQRRIGLAQALINDPDFLILDEPTTGLDPLGTRQVKDLIIELGRRGKTVLLCSHLLADVEDCVDRLVILYGGRVRAEGEGEELLTRGDFTSIESETLDERTIAEIDELIRRRSGGEKAIRRVTRPRQSLETLFLRIVESAKAEQISTSGATAGGQTAAFLKAPEGAELIERLVKAEAPGPVEAPAPPPAATGPDASLIETLVAGKKAEAPSASPPEPAPARPDAAGVDSSLIDSLVKGGPADGERTS